jgi:2-keto-4-pentenoate hydratase
MERARIAAVAERLIAAYDGARTIDPITASDPTFDVAAAYEVLREIDARRAASGWRPVGRKIGFTNRTIWSRYGVDRPMWAHVYAHTVRRAPDGRATFALAGLVQPRIEPEVVFGLRGSVPVDGDARAVLDAVEWIAAGFEVVQSHFADWKFQAADCTAAFGLHGGLIVGPATSLGDGERDRFAAELPRFELTLRRGDEIVDRGRGSHTLDSPALALQHLARVVASQPQAPPLSAGEIVTTGTLTDAWPLEPGERWSSEYGTLGVPGLDLLIEGRDGIETLILDLLEWIGPEPRGYSEVMEAWRTSCPRLPVWEEACARGLVERRRDEGAEAMASLTRLGRRVLAERRQRR